MAVTGGGVGAVGYVDVQPLVNQVDGFGSAIPQGRLHNIPYLRMQGGVNAIILDPQVGDIGVCVFSDRDISSVKTTKARANPGSRRRFDVADGLYLGGMLNGAPSQYIEFAPDRINIVSPHINLSSWVGMIAAFGMSSIPEGWLTCPTAQTLVSATTYADLFAVLGYTWGGSGGSFGIPYFATGYVPIQNTPGVLSHGVVINHTHDYSGPSGIYGQGGGASGAYQLEYYLNNVYTGNPSPGGLDNLAAGRGVQLCVKY